MAHHLRVNTDVRAPTTFRHHDTPVGILMHLWRALVASFRAVEGTPMGGLLLGNVWPAYVFALPLAARIWGFLHWRGDGSLHATAIYLQEIVTIVFLALVVALFAIRRRSLKGGHATFVPGLVALVGTFLLNIVAYLPVQDTTSTEMLFASSAVITLGTLWTMWSLAFLGRCFGLFPEARGLVTRGPYQLVRHPVYVGEIVSAVGLVLAKPDVIIGVLFVIFLALQYWRTVYEERALAAAFPADYPTYAARVPRLIPGAR